MSDEPSLETAYSVSPESKPSWQRWNVRHDFMAPGNKWDVTHDCGWTTRVDVGDDSHAIVEAQHAHERDCRRLSRTEPLAHRVDL